MLNLSRRDFLKLSGAGLLGLAGTRLPVWAAPMDYENFSNPPASLGRIATWWSQAVRAGPSPQARIIS